MPDAPITPDERAAMRARYPAGPIYEPGLLAMGMRALDDVPRLLGALDAAEAEVARLCGPHPCCEHCAEDPVHDVAPGEHEMPCTSCEADAPLGRVRRERDAALAESARVHEAAARVVADEAAESDLTITRQRDRLRAREEQVRRLRAEVTRLHALVADLRASTSPAWDEEAVVEGMARAMYPFLFADDRQPLRVFGETLREGERDVARERMRQALAVVRDHLPVKPDRETVARALAEHRLMGGRCRCGLDPRLDYYRYEQHVTDAVLAEWPGESRATVQAEALRDVVEKYAVTIPDALGYKVPAVMTEDLLARADRLAAEGGAS